MRYLITGANRGIGLGLARLLAERGDDVIATARQPQQAAELSSLAREVDGRVDIRGLDVTDPDSVARFAESLGKTPIDVIINNAGRFSHVGNVGSLDFGLFLEDYEVNTLGPLRVVDAVIDNLRAGAGGIICNITSNLGSLTQNESGDFYAYRASKAALNMVTRSLAADLADDGIIAVAMHPGWVKTDMGGEAAEITIDESVEGIVSCLDKVKVGDSGAYLTWDGHELPW